MIESQLVYTVTGVVSEAYDDDGGGVVILETRPQGSLNYFHRVNSYCDYGLTIATGERDQIYLSTPLYITVLLKADGTSIVKAIPNVAFNVRGYRWWEGCKTGFTEPYETFFDGQLINGEEIDPGQAPDREAPRYTLSERLVGVAGDGRSFVGEARAPIAVHFGGDDFPGEARVSWSLSRKK